MNTASVIYQGELRTEAEHLRSGNVLTTDAPVDNNGKGEAFSPTDLVATAAVSCMITMMGIKSRSADIDMGAVSGHVKKVMVSAPRRIGELIIELNFSQHNLSDSDKTILEAVALSCPVTRSLHPEIVINIKFNYAE